MKSKVAYYGGYPVSRPREIQNHGESDVDRTEEERQTADSNGQHKAGAGVSKDWLDSQAGSDAMRRKKKRQASVEKRVQGKKDPLTPDSSPHSLLSMGPRSDGLGMVRMASANLRALAKKKRAYRPYRDAVTYQGEDKPEAGVIDNNEDSLTYQHQIRSRNPAATGAGRPAW